MLTLILWAVILTVIANALRTASMAMTPQLLTVFGLLLVVYVLQMYRDSRKSKTQDIVIPKYKYKNAPAGYKEYLRYKALAKKYESEESFSWKKFGSGVLQTKNWAKSLVMGTMIFVICFVGHSVYKEIKSFISPKTPPVSSSINSGGGNVDSKTESKSSAKSSNGLNLNLLSNWF